MRVINSILGSLIGAIAGTGLYFLLKLTTGESYIWFPLVTGLLTGIAARNFGGHCGVAGRYFCGAFAGIVACAAIFGAEFLPSWIEQQQGKNAAPTVTELTIKKKLETEQNRDSDDSAETGADDDEGNSTEENGSDQTSDADTGGDSADENETEDEGAETSADDEMTDAEKMEQDAEKMRRRAPEGFDAEADPAAQERFAELIKKKAPESWFQFLLPFVVNGVGVFLAYQFGRGFASGEDD